jgi:hypothetical protein
VADELNGNEVEQDNDGGTRGLDNIELYNRLKGFFQVDSEHSRQWRSEAKEDFAFVAGDQWSKSDKAKLEEQDRVPITFNRCIAIIKAVCGLEINSRHETVYLPRGTNAGEVKVNEILSAAGQWMADGCDAEDEQSTAFQDAAICGMGWTEARIDYDVEADGMYVEEQVDALEMYWDKSARKKNIVDARRLFRVRKMSLAEARDMFPDEMPEDLDAPWAIGGEDGKEPKPIEQRRRKLDPAEGTDQSEDVHIVHAQWYEKVPYWRVSNPANPGAVEEVSGDEYKMLAEAAAAQGVQLTAVKQMKRVYKQAFLGSKILGDVMESPAGDRFSWSCITGELDRNKGTWFGLVRVMKDPQRWANKWLSQTLHILNTTAKGGVIAEEGAFKDMRAAQDTYAQPDAITWAAKDAIRNNRIMQKPGQGLPAGYINLLEFAISSIRDASGVNLELLGMRDANQPGVLEAQRKQAGMTILATLFDSLRRFRKQVGRVRLHYIQNYLSDGRLIRIAKDDGTTQAIPLIRDDAAGQYEVIVEDAPTSPNSKEQTWATIQQVLPAFKELLTPEAVITVLEYSPLPSKLVGAFKEMAARPNPEAEMAKQIAAAVEQVKMDRDKAAAEKDRAAAESTRVSSIIELATAGVQAAQMGLLGATDNIMSPEPWAMPKMLDAYAIEPELSNGPMAPMTPQMPQVPRGPARPLPMMAEDVEPMPPPLPGMPQ